MPTFSAVLLAGGKSTRMRCDKASLPVPGSDLLLWQRQLRVLEELRPEEIFWSGPDRPDLPGHVRIIPDAVEDAGPLAGISACLDLLQSDLLPVLAIDLPLMNALFLKRLLAQCLPSRGAVARRGDFFEPMAAIYPKSLHVLATEHLRQKRHVMQDFVREAVRRGMLQAFPLDEGDIPLFKNLNSPADMA
jgi:molybdopterin-guanine dinucleotide biosynthesis protein A